MSTAVTPAPAFRLRSRPKREQARMILTATGGLICLILFAWLFTVRLIKAPIRTGPVWGMALPVPDALGGVVGFPTADAKLLSGADLSSEAATESARIHLERELGEFLDRRRGRPVILYLSAAAASFGDASAAQCYLVTPGDSLGAAMAKVPLDDLIRLLKSKGKGSNKLLILDVGQAGPNRELGLFGADLLSGLKESIGKDTSLAVILACAPGQLSWVAEGQGGSVFAHYVAEALDGRVGQFGSITAEDLLTYVRPRVEHWVRENRGNAIQTPMLVGNAGLRLALPGRPPSGRPAAAVAETDPKLRQDLLDEWAHRQRLAAQAVPPTRHAALAWRRYQSDLLRAERLYRTASRDARMALEIARGERANVEQRMLGSGYPHPWSLAVARHAPPSGPRVDPDTYEANIGLLLSQLADPNAGAAEAPKASQTPEPANPPAGEPSKADDPKKDATDKATKSEAKERKDVPAKAKQASTPMDVLTEGGASAGSPLYVEGEVPVWYAEFVRRGGESALLREERVRGVRQAFEVRKLAEVSGRDERAAPWVRPVIDKADVLRRRGQDLLFSADAAGLGQAKAQLDQAEEVYKEAATAADSMVRAFDLIERLQDELPYYGDWLTHRRSSIDASYLEILEGAGHLCDLAYSPPADSTARDKARDELIAVAAKVERTFRSFRESAEQHAGRMTTTDDWREVDAVLYMPMIDPAKRATLLDRVGSKTLTPAFDSDSESIGSGDDKPPADPAFWNQAAGLAQVEAGLLKMAGIDDSAIWSRVVQLKSWEKEPESALALLGTVATHCRDARDRLREELGAVTGTAGPASANRIRAADRAERVLPVAELRRVDDDAARALEDMERRDLMLWQGLRLCDDFAGREARQLLNDIRQVSLTPDELKDLRAAIDLAGRRSSARLAFKEGAGAPSGFSVDREGDLPAGLAAAFLTGSSSSGVSVRAGAEKATPAPNLLAIPDQGSTPLAFAGKDGRPVGRQKPALFYRGRFFSTREALGPAKDEDFVTVQIAQRYISGTIIGRNGKKRDIKVPDQFVKHPGRGFLHPTNSLDYKLKLTNRSDQPIRLLVAHSLEGLTPYTDTVALEAGQTKDTVVGTISPSDLPDDGGERRLKVRVTEEDAEGRRVAKDLIVPFQKIKPTEQDIGVAVTYNNGQIFIEVSHSKEDRVTAPALVYLKVEPFEAIRQLDRETVNVPLGETAKYIYAIRDRTIPKIKWTLLVDEVKIREQEETINRLPEKPPTPPAIPSGGQPPDGMPEG